MAETAKVKVEFPVVADPDKVVANLYDLINPEVGLTVRGVFFIDPEGVVRFAMYYPIPLAGTSTNPPGLKPCRRWTSTGWPADRWQPGREVIVPHRRPSRRLSRPRREPTAGT
jgi:peroxiredoxin (alkyl hydroperoxide reductase subunit C)